MPTTAAATRRRLLPNRVLGASRLRALREECRSIVLVALIFGSISCRDNPSAPQTTATSGGAANAIESAVASAFAIPPPPSIASASGASPSTSSTPDDASSFEHATIKSAKAIGHTSVVFKITFGDGRAVAFKPESARGKLRYRGEAAAYRLSKALGVTNVPPAFLGTLHAKDLHDSLETTASRELFENEVQTHEGLVRGAFIPWIKGLTFAPLESEPQRAHWKSWMLKDSVPSGEYAGLAPEISELNVFDALTGNWDRWSGANIGLDADKAHLLFVDNDGAFFEPAPKAPYEATLAILRATDRYSRAEISAVRALDSASLDAALGNDETGAPLLSATQRAAILKRKGDVLRIVDAKIASLGEAAVLSF